MGDASLAGAVCACVVKAELTHPRITGLGSDTQGSWAGAAGLLTKCKGQLRCPCKRYIWLLLGLEKERRYACGYQVAGKWDAPIFFLDKKQTRMLKGCAMLLSQRLANDEAIDDWQLRSYPSFMWGKWTGRYPRACFWPNQTR